MKAVIIREKLRLCAVFVLLLCLASLLTACGKKTDDSAAAASEPAVSAEGAAAEGKLQTAGCPEMQQVLDAVEAVSEQPAFRIDTEGCLKLNGKMINGEFSVSSEVHISQGSGHSDLLMSMNSESDLDPVHYACYENGWYYTDGENGRTKEEKTPDEILSLISGTTELVEEAAAHIDQVTVTANGGDTVYTYELPGYLAKKYLKQMAKKTENSDLADITVEIDQAVLISTIDAEGNLKAQTVQVSGALDKLLFSIPAEAEFTAEFGIPDQSAPEIRTW